MLFVLLVIAAPVPLALALVRSRGAAVHGAAENLLATVFLAVTAQVGLALLLGFARVLDTAPLLVCSAALFAAGFMALRRTGVPRLLPQEGLGTLRAGVLIVVLIALGLGMADLVVHPTRNFDSLAYHLPVMARWVDAGRLEVFAELGQVALYPSHWELLSTLVVLPVGQDLLVSLPNLLAWLQLGLAIFVLARRLGARADASALAAGLVLLMPSVLSRLDAVQPDIALAACFVTALAFALRVPDEGRGLDLLIVILAVGMLPGLKLSGPVFVLMLVPALVLGPQMRWSGLSAVRERLRAPGLTPVQFAAAVTLALGLGLAWYLRNFISLGNPFGDLEISLLGWTLFDGSISGEDLRRGSLANVFRWSNADDWSVLGGTLWKWLGAGAALLVVTALAGARKRVCWYVGLLLLLCVALYWRTPYSADNGTHGWQVTPWIEVGLRYGFPALALLGVLGAVGMSRSVWLERAALLLLVVTSLLTVLDELIPNVWVLVFVVAGAWAVSMVALRGRSRTLLVPGIAALLALIVALGLARSEREAKRNLHFGSIVEVLAAELDDDDVVAVVHSHKLHLAAGMDWRRRVELPDLPRRVALDHAWVTALRAKGVTALLVGHQEPDPEAADNIRRVQAMIRASEDFVLVADYESLRKDLALFRLVQSSR